MVDQKSLLNCHWFYKCTKTLDDLVPTQDLSARHCNDCEKDVHCDTLSEFFNGKRRGDCIYFDSEVLASDRAGIGDHLVKRISKPSSPHDRRCSFA